MKRFEKAQSIADPDRGNAEGATQIAKHLVDKCAELVIVYITHDFHLS
ncbi:MAG: hypothetical protein ABI794_15715 [Betaproteobacteria bacterium]